MSAVAVDQVRRFAPIGLDELTAEADRLVRVERKYLLPAGDAWRAICGLQDGTGGARILRIGALTQFAYRSTYFDTPDRLSFFTSGRSRRGRWKVRTRSYLDTGDSRLEVKTRGPRGLTVKQRIEHPDTGQLTADGRLFVAGIVGEDVTARLRPVLVSAYHRTTLFLPWSRTRVTIDVDLDWRSPGGEGRLVVPGRAVVETKTGSTPSDMDRLLWRGGHRPVRLSKFGVGMAALNADLPRLTWRRVMDRHLGLGTGAGSDPCPVWRVSEGARS